jgi:hypothetical protein
MTAWMKDGVDEWRRGWMAVLMKDGVDEWRR